MTESALLALLGAIVGLVVAWWGSRALLAVAGDGDAMPLVVGIDLRVLAFTLGVAVVTVVVFGLAPALRASRVGRFGRARTRSRADSRRVVCVCR
jgi:ABC-type antimicrobial peptide transport system permease subunit